MEKVRKVRGKYQKSRTHILIGYDERRKMFFQQVIRLLYAEAYIQRIIFREAATCWLPRVSRASSNINTKKTVAPSNAE